MRTILSLVLVLSLASCKGKKEAAPAPESDTACETSDDCGDGELCLDGECASGSLKTIVTDPSNAVTPDKVKREVDKIQKANTAKVDKSLDL